MQFPIKAKFELSETFLESYKSLLPPFGFNGLGEFVFMRTYSRIKEDGKNEAWWETVKRVVEGIYSIQKQHIEDYSLGWNQAKAQRSAQEMFDRIFNFKMLPAGRSLWSMGAPVIMEKGLAAALYNCAYLSTEKLKDDPAKPFCYAMDMLMCGVGVGADTLGANKVKVKGVNEHTFTYVIPDTREGWVESLRLLIEAYVNGTELPIFDYTLVRPAGVPIKTFGGVASGPGPLIDLHLKVKNILEGIRGQFITEREIVDIFNLIGKTVVAGNVRRSAEIMLGPATEDFLNLKDYDKNPDRIDFGWASNNSVYGTVGMDYSAIAERIRKNGEPGVFWLENAKRFGRMIDSEDDDKDFKVRGLNPCGEITLESYELCNLVELFPTKHESLADFLDTVKYAYMYAKTITLLYTHWEDTNRVMLRNRRIGLSMTGIAQFVSEKGTATLVDWMRMAFSRVKHYDKVYSDWFAIPQSVKVTTIKPSGTLSLLAGVTPGIHFPESKFYIRRVRLAMNSPFVEILKEAGYNIEPAVGQEDSTVVVEFPVALGNKIRTLKEVSMWEQIELASLAQKNWADNSVSVTVTFDQETEGKDVEHALNYAQFNLKAVSFLPRLEYGAYPQMPYEEITEERYTEMVEKLIPIDFTNLFSESVGEKYCSNDTCVV